MKGILATYHKLELPSYAEGFDELYDVHIAEDGNFRVGRWKDEV